MKKKIVSLLLAALMCVSLLPVMAFAATEPACTYERKVLAPTDGAVLQMRLKSMPVGGFFKFNWVGNGFVLEKYEKPGSTVGMIRDRYLCLTEGAYGTSAVSWSSDINDAAVFAYENGMLYAPAGEMAKSEGHWYGMLYIPGQYYYASPTDMENRQYFSGDVLASSTEIPISISKNPITLSFYSTGAYQKHDYSGWFYTGYGHHARICKQCGDIEYEACTYKSSSHICKVCGWYLLSGEREATKKYTQTIDSISNTVTTIKALMENLHRTMDFLKNVASFCSKNLPSSYTPTDIGGWVSKHLGSDLTITGDAGHGCLLDLLYHGK